MVSLVPVLITLLVPLFTSTDAPSTTLSSGTNAISTPNTTNIADHILTLPPNTRHALVTNHGSQLLIFWLAVALWLGVGVSLAIKAHRRRVFDPTLVLKFEKEFEDLSEERARAAGALLLYSLTGDWNKVPQGADIEPVLDFFDNLGFYLYGDQLSERVIHQSFCHWLVLYYHDGCSYIRIRQDGPDGERSTWEHIEFLITEVYDLEAAKQGCSREGLRLSPPKYKKYLMEEFDGGDDSFKAEFQKAHPMLFNDTGRAY